MNLAYIIVAHKNFQQVRRLIRRLDDDRSRFAVTVDRRAPGAEFDAFRESLASNPRVRFLPRRIIRWGGLSQAMTAQIALQWFLDSDFRFDYVLNLSGQDYPLMNPRQIRRTLAAGGGKSFITCEPFPVKRWNAGQMGRIYSWNFFRGRKVYEFPKWDRAERPWVRAFYAVANRLTPPRSPLPMGMRPYGGSAHWSLSREAAEHIAEFRRSNPKWDRRWRFTRHADESYCQTILGNSPLKDRLIESDLRYMHWPSKYAESPMVLTCENLPQIIASNAVFARKFDVTVDAKVLDLIDAAVDEAVDAPADAEQRARQTRSPASPAVSLAWAS
jgi:hypothetical protein